MKRAINESIVWQAPEHKALHKEFDWFIAIGIVAITGAGIALFFKNFFFALLVLVATGTLFLIARKSPKEVRVSLSKDGIVVGGMHIHKDSIIAFDITQEEGEQVLRLKTNNLLRPYVTIHMPRYYEDDVRAYFQNLNIPEEEIRESVTDQVSRMLGF